MAPWMDGPANSRRKNQHLEKCFGKYSSTLTDRRTDRRTVVMDAYTICELPGLESIKTVARVMPHKWAHWPRYLGMSVFFEVFGRLRRCQAKLRYLVKNENWIICFSFSGLSDITGHPPKTSYDRQKATNIFCMRKNSDRQTSNHLLDGDGRGKHLHVNKVSGIC